MRAQMPATPDPAGIRMRGLRRERGQYYTRANPFEHGAFRSWARRAGLPGEAVLEPFAGANCLIRHLEDLGLCGEYAAFDVDPSSEDVRRRDTLASFPEGYSACVTNPPWLARNSARLRGLGFPDTRHDDLYKHALSLCLANCGWVAALVPESFVRSGLFQDRLTDFVSYTARLFEDTAHPVGLALFSPGESGGAAVWSQNERVGPLPELLAQSPAPVDGGCPVAFNDPEGNVGLLAIDNTRGRSIRFCEPGELGGRRIRHTSRGITRMRVGARVDIDGCNAFLEGFRSETRDVLLTSYRGLRRDGMYRRRLDWRQARGIVQRVVAGDAGGLF